MQGEPCPHCGRIMVWSQINQQWYCNKCELFIQPGGRAPSAFDNIRSEVRGYRSPQPQQGYSCPWCHGPLSFVHQYNRWYCHRCQRYV